MIRQTMFSLAALGAFAMAGTAIAQPPRPERGGPPPRDGRPGDRPPRRPEGPPPVDPIRTALDADGDGVLSAEEIAGATAALKKLDRNGDGKLTRDELRPAGPPPRGQRPGRDRGDGPAAAQGPGNGPPPRRNGPRGGERPPRPKLGSVLPPFVRGELELSAEQQKQVTQMESNVKKQLQEVLSEAQQQQFAKLIEKGPPGPPPGGPRERDEADGYGYPAPRR